MIRTDWRKRVLVHLLSLLAVCLLMGALTGQYAWMLALGLAVYLGWLLIQLLRLQKWLSLRPAHEAPPVSRGLWGEVFDSLYHLQRYHLRVQARLQAVVEQMQASTAALRDAVVILDRQGSLRWWNKAAETLLGLKMPQDAGQPISNLVRDPRFKSYFERGLYTEPLEMLSPVLRDVHLQFDVIRYGEGEYLLQARNISRLHRLEQMRKDFIANVSHELRTPLTVTNGYLETLLDHAETLPPRWMRPLQQMQQQGARMQALLDDLLWLARLEATDHPADSQPVAVAALLSTIKSDARVLSAGRQRITLEADPQLMLQGDETELRSAFSNLLFNAVKYTPAGSEIQIRWWADEQGAHCQVSDTGPGIEARHLPRLTERFYRVDAGRASDSGGTGLGLAIVKHVLLRHGGWLDISSTPGQGSRFTCHFHAARLVRP